MDGSAVSYHQYKDYIADKTKIDDAKAYIEDAEGKAQEREGQEEKYEAAVAEAQANGTELPAEPVWIVVPEITQAQRDLAAKYVDQSGYLAELDRRLAGLKSSLNVTSTLISFGEVESAIDDLSSLQGDVEGELGKIEEQVSTLKTQLANCSEELRKPMEEEVKELEKITEMAGDFKDTVELFKTADYDSVNKDNSNKGLWDEQTAILGEVETQLRAGSQNVDDWKLTISFQWKSFREDANTEEFYLSLEDFFNSTETNGQKANKKAGDEKIEAANTKKDEALKNAGLDKDETCEARDITKDLSNQLGSIVDTGEVPGFTDWMFGDASLKDLGNGAIGKFLLSIYDFGMFSSRVTGIEPEDKNENLAGTTAEEITESIENIQNASQEIIDEYFDESLTGIKMSKDVNYLYGAEIEYLLSGYDTSDKNLTNARNYICAVRMTTNFISTYTITPINSAISVAADSAAAAVAATVVGSVAAPLVRFAVSGALRAAVAGIETASDWSRLKDRKAVVFYKRSIDDLTSKDGFINVLVGDLDKTLDTKVDNDIKLTYEDYMYVLMCLFVDSGTLLERTSNLITLNVNQAEQKADKLTTLNFKMNSTVTAVKSTCTIDIDFVIVPEGFVNMFLPDSDATNVIQKLEDGTYGYSVIRSY